MSHEITGSYDKMQSSSEVTMFAQLMRNVYLWMALGLLMTGLTAMTIAKNEGLVYTIFSNAPLFWGIAIVELALVMILSAALNKLSFATAGIMFAIYAILNGVTMSLIFFAYTSESIAQTFFVTSGTFAAMSAFGYFTKRDLSFIGRILIMLLIGLIITTLVNLFFKNSMVESITNYVGIVLFVGLTAYDTQKIKKMLLAGSHSDLDGSTLSKLALLGSLELYLDFVNLFLYLLRFMGKRK